MEFIFEDSHPKLTFADVSINQFFVDEYQYLCQKVSTTRFNRIADSEGNPFSDSVRLEDENCTMEIIRLLPRVKKINF